MHQSYKPEKLDIQPPENHTGSWSAFGRSAVKGIEYFYTVKDTNFRSLNQWTIAIRVPNVPRGNVIVQPIRTPGKKVWAGIERKAIVLVRATKHPYRKKVYCKLNLADPTGGKTKKGARRGDRSALPKWFVFFENRMRLKQTVTTTRGTDANAQVVMLGHDDHKAMIALYFALKVWVMAEGFILDQG